MKAKLVKDSFSKIEELVLPNDTNTLGNLMGGRLMYLMDVITAIAAMKHTNRTVVTAGVDNIDFRSSVRLGELVVLEAFVTRAFNTSMEVFVEVYGQNLQTGEVRLCNQAFFTFVAVDQSGNTIPVNPVIPESEREKVLFEEALTRRQLRLLLAGRLKPEEASYIKKFLGFDTEKVYEKNN